LRAGKNLGISITENTLRRLSVNSVPSVVSLSLDPLNIAVVIRGSGAGTVGGPMEARDERHAPLNVDARRLLRPDPS